MTRWIVGIVVASALLASGAAAQVGVSTMRCGDRVIPVGETEGVVTGACGQPDRQEHSVRAFAPTRGASRVIQIDRWTYDATPGEMSRVLVFEDRVLVSIQLVR